MERETETVQNPLTEPQNRLTGPQNLQQATELQSQATVHLLPTTGLQSLPTVFLGRDSLHLVLGKFKSDVVDNYIIQGHLHVYTHYPQVRSPVREYGARLLSGSPAQQLLPTSEPGSAGWTRSKSDRLTLNIEHFQVKM